MKPVNNLIVVNPILVEEVTTSGIVIANYAPQSKFEREIYPHKGTVVALADTVEDFKLGDIVHFLRWGATEYEFEGKTCLFINPKDIIAKEE